MKHTDRKDKIAVVVGTVTNDVRILEVPKLTVSGCCHGSLRSGLFAPGIVECNVNHTQTTPISCGRTQPD